MKWLLYIIILVLFTASCSNINYHTVGGSKNILTYEFGEVANNQLFGVGFIQIEHNDSIDEFTEVERGSEYSIYGKYGIEIIDNTNLFLSVFGGASLCEETELISFYHNEQYGQFLGEDSYHYKDEKEEYVMYPIYGIGLNYIPIDGLVLTVNYGNRTEITGAIGWRFGF